MKQLFGEMTADKQTYVCETIMRAVNHILPDDAYMVAMLVAIAERKKAVFCHADNEDPEQNKSLISALEEALAKLKSELTNP